MTSMLRRLIPAVAGLILLWPSLVRTQSGQLVRERIGGREVAAGEVLVRLRDQGAASRAELRRLVDASEDQPVGSQGWRRLRSSSRGAQALLQYLRTRGDVLEVEPNYILRGVDTLPNDPSFQYQWGFNNQGTAGADIHVRGAWDISTGSVANVVAVVDTGVDATHPDLAANMWSAPSAFTVNVAGEPVSCPAGTHGFNAIAFRTWLIQGQPSSGPLRAAICSASDDNGHGTHIAGTIGAVGNNGIGVTGVNWTTRIMSLKFLGASAEGTTADAINALDFAVAIKAFFASQNGANVRVLNNSYGGSDQSTGFRFAVEQTGVANMLFVAAAGNNNRDNDVTPYFPASFPDESVLAVAATDSDDRKADFSSFGQNSVDLGAPGASILSTTIGGGYGGNSGTSMATPHVAGAAALVLSACSLNTSQLKAALMANVDQVPAMSGITVTGGRLNVDRSIRSCATVPSVTVTSPATGSAYTAPAAISLEALATDVDGISKVEFYAGTALVHTATASPFGGTWTNVPAGVYAITAKAYDRAGTTATSAPVTVTVNSAGGGLPTNASFAGTDTTTKGSWRTTYGSEGYVVVADGQSLPAFATVTAAGQNLYGYGDTADVRGLQKVGGSGRISAVWYGETFTIDVNLTDGAAHQVALYGLDWDGTSRAQTIEVRDAASNALLDTRSVSGFNGGQYWRWVVSGHVRFRLIRTGGWNAVVNGVFLDAAAAVNPPPTVAMTAPASGATYTAPATIPLGAQAADADGISKVEFYAGTTLVGTATTSPFGGTWTNVPAGTYALTAKAYDNAGRTATSSPVTVTVSPAGGGLPANASFAGTDTTTKGSWRTAYGGEGAVVVADGQSLPGWATVTATGQNTYGYGDTADVRGLQKVGGSGRISAVWYGETFTLDVNLSDGAAHQVALYLLDWDSTTRAQTIEVRDAVTNAVLDSRSASGFSGGQYWRWVVSGHVRFRLIRTGGWNAVVNGVFLDAASAANPPPTVTMTTPGAPATYTAPAAIALGATASDADGISKVEFYAGTTLIGTSTASPYSGTWTNVPAGVYAITAKAYDNAGRTATSTPVTVTVNPAGGGLPTNAAFAGTDTTTKGSWRTTYGGEGYIVVADGQSLPAFATMAPAGQNLYGYGDTADVRGLQKVGGSGRISAVWYGETFTIDVNLTDGAAHQIALYGLDWDSTSRAQTIEVRNAETNALLDTRSVSGFNGGQYWRWVVSGHVRFRLIRTGGWNAVVNGVFLDPAVGTSSRSTGN